uniref:C2H2-type domain-containing protein n=1 Tax=Strongyloides venezuelensis TaxID=75913 RepID=A0A0K0FU98_STRVS
MIHISSTPFICQYESCNLVWRNQKELLWHQQNAHIPQIKKQYDAEMSLAENPQARNEIYNKTKLKTILVYPLNFHFDIPPTPIEYEKYNLNFNIYTKNIVVQNENHSLQARASSNQAQVQKAMQLALQAGQENGDNSDFDGKYNGVDPSWLKPVEDRKYRCTVEGCNKKYKNMPGYRQHMRTAHGETMLKPPNTPLADDSSLDSSYFEEQMGQSGSMELKKGPEIIRDKVYKCRECNKTYKTAQGLHTHIHANHSKTSPKFNDKYVQSRIAMDPMAREDSPAKISTFGGPTPPKQSKVIQRSQVGPGFSGQMTISNPSPKSLYVAKQTPLSPSSRNETQKPLPQLNSVLLNSQSSIVVPSPVPQRPSTMGMNIVNKNPVYQTSSNLLPVIQNSVVSPSQKNQSQANVSISQPSQISSPLAK